MQRQPGLAIIVFLLLPVAAAAQLFEDPTLPQAGEPLAPADVRDPATRDPAVAALLDFDFDRAEALFAERAKGNPKSPDGALGLAMVSWWRLIAARDPVDPKRLEKQLDRAIEISRDLTYNGGSRAEALYYSGQAHGYLSRLYVVQGQFLKAYRAAQRSRSYLLTCLKEDPEMADAYLGLGIYHYYADALPNYVKLVGWLLGLRGDRERGLKELRFAARNGDRTRGEAAYFLMNVLVNFEGRPLAGLDLGRWLLQTYPNNHVFFLEYQNVLESLGYFQEAEQALRQAYGSGGRFEGSPSIMLMLGRNLFRQARYAEGAHLLESVIPASPGKADPLSPWLHYFAGRCRDLDGDWNAAERHYRAAEKAEIGGNINQLAEKRRKNPEGEARRRLRNAQGIGRQPGREIEAAGLLEALAIDLEGGRLDAEGINVPELRYRQAICLEQAHRFEDAHRIYAGITDESLLSRSVLAAARCLWREGQQARSLAMLDSLSRSTEFSGQRQAARMAQVMSRSRCETEEVSPESKGPEVFFRDDEAWVVELVVRDQGGSTRCFPMRYERGIWRAHLPVVDGDLRYYYRVDGSRHQPDPLCQWERGERSVIWSLGLTTHTDVTRPEWSRLSSRGASSYSYR